jgi:hypothetical protein
MALGSSGVSDVPDDRVEGGEGSDARKIGCHAWVSPHRLDGSGVAPLGVNDDARAVSRRDEVGGDPTVESANHGIDVVAEELEEPRLVCWIDGQDIDERGHGEFLRG